MSKTLRTCHIVRSQGLRVPRFLGFNARKLKVQGPVSKTTQNIYLLQGREGRSGVCAIIATYTQSTKDRQIQGGQWFNSGSLRITSRRKSG